MSNIRKIVFDNLNNAVDNGCDLNKQSGNDIVRELKKYASDCENIEASKLLTHVLEWKREPSKR